MIDYLDAQEEKYNTDQEEAIECMMQKQAGQERRRAPRWADMEVKIAMRDYKSSGGKS